MDKNEMVASDWDIDKPISLSVKDFIIRKMSAKTMTPERVIEAIVNHQFTSAHKAMTTCESLEFSGFGKFCFNKKKVTYKMKRMFDMKEALEKMVKNMEITAQKRHSTALKLITLNKDIELLKPKLNA